MKLIDLELQEFKGMTYKLELDGKSAVVLGDNETGKTTLYDAFLWLLFGKDSQGNANFEIKTRTDSGEPKHGMEHGVTATIQKGNETVKLSKVYKEKWQNKKGSTEKHFTGHETVCEVNDVPVKKTDFEEKVDELMEEDMFRLLTSPMYFHEQLHWSDRQKILLDVCGDVTFDDVIESNDELEDLPEILGGKDIEDYQAEVKSKKKKINKKLDSIPERIDELELGKNDVPLSEDELEDRISGIDDKISELQQKKARLEEGNVGDIKESLATVKNNISDLKSALSEEGQGLVQKKREKLSEAKSKRADVIRENDRVTDRIETLENKVEVLNEEREDLREKFYEVKEEEWEPEEGETVCPTCGQELPEEQVEEARQKAQGEFNQEKSEKLEQIQRKGKKKASEVEKLEEELDKLKEKREDVTYQMNQLKTKVEHLEVGLKQAKKKAEEFESPKLEKLQEKKESLEKQLDQKKEIANKETARVEEEIQSHREEKQSLQDQLNKARQNKKTDERISELKQQSEEMSKQYEKMEYHEHLMDLFKEAKIDLLEDTINSQFNLAKFELYEPQINGGWKETCVARHKGVRYDRGLNRGARINVGLDIIQTLSEAYGQDAPIFIDNAEAVTDIYEMDQQTIELQVSPDYDTLHVETVEKTEEVEDAPDDGDEDDVSEEEESAEQPLF